MYLVAFNNSIHLVTRRNITLSHGRHYCSKADQVWDEIGVPLSPPNVALWVNSVFRFGRVYGPLVEVLDFMSKKVGINRNRFKSQHINNLLNKHFQDVQLNPVKIIPRVKEGGCYVYFEDAQSAEKACIHINSTKFRNRNVDAYIVKGEPFIEDMVMLTATPKLKVVVTTTATLEMDDMFYRFRPFGKVQNIIIDKNVVHVLFIEKESAISARNCLHNKYDPDLGGRMEISYSEYSRWRHVQSLLSYMKSPKLLPVIIFIISLILLMLIEPVRLTNVCKTLARPWHENGVPPHNLRKKELNTLEEILGKGPTSVILVSGPPASGKSTLMQRLVHNRSFAIRVKCSNNTSMTGSIEDAFINNLESSIGFSPSFSAINTFWSYVEALLPSQNALYDSKLVQLETLLSTLQKSLILLSVLSYSKKKPIIVFDQFHELVGKLETVPVSEREKAETLFKGLLQWSITNLHNQTAHIIFVGDVSTEEKLKELDSTLRGQITTFYLEDIPKEDAEKYLTYKNKAEVLEEVVKARGRERFSFLRVLGVYRNSRGIRSGVEEDTRALLTPGEAKIAVEIVGGRPGHLSSLKNHIKRGQTLQDAIDLLLMEIETNILTNGFGKKNMSQLETDKIWNKIQLWNTMMVFQENKKVPVSVLLRDVFDGNNEAMQALIRAKFLQTKTEKSQTQGYQVFVEPASPLTLHAFREICKDETMRTRMNSLIISTKTNSIMKEILEIEEELMRLSSPPIMEGVGVYSRIGNLDNKLGGLQKELEKLC